MRDYGYIYIITDNTNNKNYIGQTSIDVDARLDEHLSNENSSVLYRAIKEHGWKNFSVKELESVPFNELDDKEKYWIEYYKSDKYGYNENPTNVIINSESEKLYVPKKGIYIKSIEHFADLCHKTVLWSKDITIKNIEDAIINNRKYLGYNFQLKRVNDLDCEYDDIVIDWIKTLKKINDSKVIYSPELNMCFLNPNEAASFCLKNNLYKSYTNYPEQELRGLIVKMLNHRLKTIYGMENYHFIERYGSKKEI